MHTFFEGIFTTSTITITNFLLCLFVSLAIGMFLALIYDRKLCSRSFLVTLALLPAVVCVVIMMVNGNVGAGVAVAGAFSLVRFRSVPGTARAEHTLGLPVTQQQVDELQKQLTAGNAAVQQGRQCPAA